MVFYLPSYLGQTTTNRPLIGWLKPSGSFLKVRAKCFTTETQQGWGTREKKVLILTPLPSEQLTIQSPHRLPLLTGCWVPLVPPKTCFGLPARQLPVLLSSIRNFSLNLLSVKKLNQAYQVNSKAIYTTLESKASLGVETEDSNNLSIARQKTISISTELRRRSKQVQNG